MLNLNHLLSLKEFSILAGISLRTTAKLVANGELKTIRVGRRRLIAPATMSRFMVSDHVTVVSPKKVRR